jgi:RHS repeat-associated protein
VDFGCSQESGLSSSATTKNQLSTYGYDAAGNVISIPAVANYSYDAENHLVSAGGVNYTYDGDGKRLMKSSGEIYWYGAGTDVMEQTDSAGNLQYRHFYFNGRRIKRQDGFHGWWLDQYIYDALGNARIVYGYQGGWDQSVYYPYGGERVISSAAGSPWKFTGKERDSESGNDYFGARYYASSVARWLSPDWSANVMPVPFAKLGNPQSLNLYAYVLDNPLGNADPDGHCGADFGCWIGAALGVMQGIQLDGGGGAYAKNLGLGVLKGAGRAVVNTANMAAAGTNPGAVAAAALSPGPKALQPSNTTQAQASIATQIALPQLQAWALALRPR